MIKESKEAMYYINFFILPLLYSCHVIDMIQKLQ